MIRKSTLSFVMALTLFASMLCFPSAAQAQPRPNRFRGDTGVITLGVGQVLRVTVNGQNGNDTIRARFAWMKYMPSGCNTEGVCLHAIQSQGITAPVTIQGNEAASFDMQGAGGGVRVSVRVSTADVTGDALIINNATGEVVSHVIMANTEGDFH